MNRIRPMHTRAALALGLAALTVAFAPPPARAALEVSQVEDIRVGSADSEPFRTDRAVLGDKVIFAAETDVEGIEPWVSDGTAEGTFMLRNIAPDTDERPGSSIPADFEVMDGKVYFRANEGPLATGDELWVTDGTTAGTQLVKDIQDFLSSAPSQLTAVKLAGENTLFFLANSDGVDGYELWRSDGTQSGTAMVADLEIESLEVEFARLTAAGGRLFFYADDGSGAGKELWTSDGTDAGTEMLEVQPGPEDGIPPGVSSANHETDQIAFKGKLYFRGDGGTENGGRELWESDGTGAGTKLAADINPGYNGGLDGLHFAANFFTESGGRLLFRALSLYAFDGTEGAAAIRLADAGYAADIADVDGTAYFFQRTNELWKTAGTPETTELVEVIGDTSPSGEALPGLTSFQGRAWFRDDGADGAGIELWSSDGTAAGTERLSDIDPGPDSSLVNRLTVAGDTLFFRADDGQTGVELWKLAEETQPDPDPDPVDPDPGPGDPVDPGPGDPADPGPGDPTDPGPGDPADPSDPDPPAGEVETGIADLDVTAAKVQKQRGRQIKIKVGVGAQTRIEATGSGKIKIGKPKGSFRLRPASKSVEAGERTILALKPRSKRNAKKIKRAVKRYRRVSRERKKKLAVRAPIKVVAIDAGGDRGVEKRVVRLK